MAKKSYKQWTVCRFKRGLGEKEWMVFLSFWMVGDGGSYLDVYYVIYTTLIERHLPLHTSGKSTTLCRTFLVLLLQKQHYYVQCPYHSLLRNTECLFLYFCRCHYFFKQWTVSLRCVIIVRSWVSKYFVVSGILSIHKMTDLTFLCLSYVSSIVCIGVSVTPQKYPLLSCQPPTPPLNLQTVQASSFRLSSLYIGFLWTPISKTRVFLRTPKILKFFILHPILSFKSN